MDIDKLITEATRLRLGPGEVLVLKLESDVSLPELSLLEEMRFRFANALGVDHKRILFLDDAISMSIVSVAGDDNEILSETKPCLIWIDDEGIVDAMKYYIRRDQ